MESNEGLRNYRDLSSVQRWVESSDFGRKGGKGVAKYIRWASIDMEEIAYAPDEGAESEHGDRADWISSQDRPPVHPSHLERLKRILAETDRDAEVLELVDECPSEEEWDVLGQHFRNVRWLLVETGFNESWIDRGFPLGWPLDLLVVSSACGELVTTPAILEGRISHLVLLLTCNLRFEGPGNPELDTSEELCNEAEAQLNENKTGITIMYRPSRVYKWLAHKYSGLRQWPDPGWEDRPVSRLKTLEILENDAFDTFQRLAMAHSHLIMGLEKLNLRSMHGEDFALTPEDLFPQFFPAMTNLKHLELSLSHQFNNDTILPNLYRCLPPNLESLSFRGPPSLAGSGQFDEWIAAFGNPALLPSLKRLSFALDAAGTEAKLSELAWATRSANRLLARASARGVVVEQFRDPWYEVSFFRRYDQRS